MRLPSFMANRFLTWLTNVFFGTQLTDMETCYKIMPTDLAKSLELKSKAFEIEPEFAGKLAKKKISILELPIHYYGRTASEGKKIKAKDFFMAVRTLIQLRLS